MTRRDWWILVCVLAAALTLHALVPRYEWRSVPGYDGDRWSREDRWTGDLMMFETYADGTLRAYARTVD